MKNSSHGTSAGLGRRAFIKKASGLAGLVAAGMSLSEIAASSGTMLNVRKRSDLEKLLPELEDQNEKFLFFDHADGRLLHLLAATARPRRVLELGTCLGYATLWLATAVGETRGNIISIEIMPERVEVARKRLARAGFSKRVTLLEGDGHKLLAGIPGPFDFVFLNADKTGNVDYFQKLHPRKLSPGALLLAYGATTRKEQMQDYLKMITAHADFDTVILSAGLDDSFCVSRRHS